MKCEKLREEFMEAVLSGPEAASPELQEHLRSCAACAGELASFQADDDAARRVAGAGAIPVFQFAVAWRACARSLPYRREVGWHGLRRPVASGGRGGLDRGWRWIAGDWSLHARPNTLATNDGVIRSGAPGSAVSDLQYLDKNADLFSDFDALDGQSSTE